MIGYNMQTKFALVKFAKKIWFGEKMVIILTGNYEVFYLKIHPKDL